MSEESPYGAHPVAAPNHYAQVPQPHGGVYRPGVAPAHHPYVYREQGGPGYNMNGIAGGSHAFRAPMPATPRGSPPTPAQAQWQSSYYQTPVSQEAVQPAHAPASYPPPEPQGPWNKTPNTSFARPQASSQGQSFSNTHNYNHYSRPHHNPMEPSAAPSPPNLYPSSPRTPVSAHQTVGSSSIPQPPPFRQPNPRPLTPSSAMSLGVPTENAAHRPEPPSRFVESPSTTHSLMTRNPVRGHMASPLGPPVSVNGTQRGSSFNNTHRNSESYVSQLSSVDNEGGERPASAPKTMRFHGSQSEYDSADDEKPKRIKREPDSPSTALSPTTIRIDICPDSDRSPSFPGPVNKPNGLEMSGKKKGSPVFRDAKGNEYYENEPVPPGVIVPEGWQLGTGKLTKGLLLPCAKDGIAVNPEWGFTAGGKARQRLPQACRNCRAKKIRCVESDYDETVCQHCSKMRITCQREDDKKKKRASQSHDYPKSESNSGERSGSVLSDFGHDTKMSAPVKNGSSKKRKSTDESQAGTKRPNRGASSRASSISREQTVNTVLANSSVPSRPAIHSAPLESARPPMFPVDPGMDAQAVVPGNQTERSRKEITRVIRDQNQSHGRSQSLPDSSPISFSTTPSPAISVSSLAPGGGGGGYLDSSSSYTQDHHERYTSEASMIDTRHMLNIHRPIGEDPRHPDLPGLELLRHLVDAYFSNIYSQTYAFLHRPSFEENWHKHPAVLLFSMCAVAARFSRCTKDQARIFEARARELIMQKYDDYSLEMVQSMVHMGLHDFGSNNGSKAWMFAGMAVRMGAALNMNLESRKKDKKKDAVIKECTRRTYWSYYLMDRFNSYGVARPFLTQDHDCHIQLPCNQPSFTEGKYVPTEHLLGPNPYNPAVGTKYMGAMAFLVRIVSIWGNILKQIHLGAFPTEPKDQPRRQMASQELTFFEEFIEKLENWRKSLPRGLEYSNENLAGQISVGTTGAFVTMHVMWHTAMAYVHRYVRTVGVPKDYIHENIQPEVIIESIRKAFVHADAVLQIMVHVRQQRDRAASRNESPVIVNAPFLGQAISDACNITIIRALEVRGEPGGAGEQRRRVRCGLEWLRELRRYWKPIEGMYQKLKKTYRDLDRNTTFTSSSAHMVPTPESVDSSLHPGSTYPVDPANYTAETFNSGSMTALGSEPIWHHFTDQFMAFGVDNGAYFGQAFDNSSHPVLSEYARNEGGFPHLYGEFSDEHMTAVSTSFSYDIASNPAMVAEMMPMQLDTSTVPPHDNTFELGDQELENSDDSDNEHEVDGGAGAEKSRDSINAIYFDAAAVQHGTLPDSGSEGSGHSRRASDVGVAVPSKPDNPMDLLHLINQENMDGISASLQSRQNEKDQFTGPNGAAAPMNNDLGGQPNLDNSGAEAHVL